MAKYERKVRGAVTIIDEGRARREMNAFERSDDAQTVVEGNTTIYQNSEGKEIARYTKK